MPVPWNLFYSYSHEDAALRDELAKFLAPLKQQQRIIEWYDRKIEPGLEWETAISDKLESANLILLLISAAFLASDYCFGVEMEVAMRKAKDANARIVPILLRPCLWKESRFSELQLLPRNAEPVTSWPSHDEAFTQVAAEIGAITKTPPGVSESTGEPGDQPRKVDLTVVRDQVIAYARLYERVRQQMDHSAVRTEKLQEVFDRMKALANSAVLLLPEFVTSHSPGEKLAAVSVLSCFGSAKYIGFLVDLIRAEKPFIGFHAARALEFAVSAIEPRYYPQLRKAIQVARTALKAAAPDSDRVAILTRADAKLKEAMATVALPAQPPHA